MLFNSAPWFFNRDLYDQGSHDIKLRNLAAVAFEPTPPKRLVPKMSALCHSATLPNGLNIGLKHCKSVALIICQCSEIRLLPV